MEYIYIIFLITLIHTSTCQQTPDLGIECDAGYTLLSGGKCVKVYQGIVSWNSAQDICKRYGSRLVTIKDQLDNNKVGDHVAAMTGRDDTSYWIGLSQSYESSCSCEELKWENGMTTTENTGYWMDKQPDDTMGNCVFSQKNTDFFYYVYDRPYAWSFDNCNRKRAFVCEKMAAPQGCFHCFSGGFVRGNDKCDPNGIQHCPDGSDELECPGRCRYLHQGSSGSLTRLVYQDSQTCTWAIITPIGTSAYVELDPFQTESGADFISVFAGSVLEREAVRIDRISGQHQSKRYRSWNNMMLVKFTSDSSVIGRGFNATYGSSAPSQIDETIYLTAQTNQKSYTISQDIANVNSFVGMYDYTIVITASNDVIGEIITLEVSEMMLNDGDYIEIYDGATPYNPVLAKMCKTCNNDYKVVFSTGTQMSILFRRMRSLDMDVRFSFKYTQGCYYASSDKWGIFSSPGYPAAINYPNFLTCTWRIEPRDPIAVYFDMDLVLIDEDFGRVDNGDFLEMYNNGTKVHSTNRGFNSSELAGNTFHISSGILEIRFRSSPIRSARGFMGSWSIGCENPNYDQFTISTPAFGSYYTAKMTLRCENGYDFQQEQIQTNTATVELECGFKGVWKTFRQIPRCTPIYCADVPSIANGYIEFSEGSVFGKTAGYQCFPGSSLAGSSNITCQANTVWSSPPSCITASCNLQTLSQTIANGQFNFKNEDGRKIGSIMEYSCNAGFELVGEPLVFCQTNGTYTNSAPSCRRLKCLLPPIANGQYLNLPAGTLIDYQSSTIVTCNTGYTLVDAGVNSVTCQANRTLTQHPACTDINECDNNPCGHNCFNTDGSFYCTCNAGFELQGDSRTCLDIDECQRGTHTCDQNCLDTQGSYTCGCDLPYVLFTANGVSGYQIPTALGETGLLPTDTFHINQTCVLIECPMPSSAINAAIMDDRAHHRFGDWIEYRCNIGYLPTSTLLQCQEDGTWSGAPPTCQMANCPDENINPATLQNAAAYNAGPYAYNERLYLNCTKGGQTYSQYRHCIYDPSTDTYKLEGSPYDCGDINCGGIESQFSNFVTDQVYPAQFNAQCPPGTSLQGVGSVGSGTSIVCDADGFWKYGNLQCVGQSCSDPGYPAGGNIIATSFATNSLASFSCSEPGYTLKTSVQNLTCQGTTWSAVTPVDVNGCEDTQKPTFSGACGTSLTYKKYERLALKLPPVSVSDNTGIQELTIFPANANSTLFVDQALSVTRTARDHAGNTETCIVSVGVEDETPPTITCPTLQNIYLQREDSSQTFELNQAQFPTNDNIPNNINAFSIIQQLPLSNFTIADLYNTFTYIAEVRDLSDNAARCSGQVYVSPNTGCSELSIPKPVNGVKTCTTNLGVLSCQISCNDRYTFQNIASKTTTITCNSVTGVWDREIIPACVLDITPPAITCPSSETIYLTNENEERFVDFTQQPYTVLDLNTIASREFDFPNVTFTRADLFNTRQITLVVTDLAQNSANCKFQYTVLPTVCSPLSFPQPLNAKPNVCSRRNDLFNQGFDCTIECNDGFVLRGHGYSKTLQCTDNAMWTEIHTACIADTLPPVVACPASRTLALSGSTSPYNVTFGVDNRFIGIATDVGGVASITYEPPYLTIDSSSVYQQRRTVTMRARDRGGRETTCNFFVLAEADVCSDLSIPAPVNGFKSCSQNLNQGWTCNFTCEAGYSFVNTLDPFILVSCNPGFSFNQFIPSCVTVTFSQQKAFIGTLRYQYVPKAGGVQTVDPTCLTQYFNALNASSVTSQSIFSQMAGKLRGICLAVREHAVVYRFVSYNGTVVADPNMNNDLRIVTMDYDYTVTNGNNTAYNECADAVSRNVDGTEGFTLAQDIELTTVTTCPDLQWNNYADQIRIGFYCTVPYYEYLTNTDLCVLCPAGTSSDGVTCSPCPLGSYRDSSSTGQCQSCPNNGMTRYPGATSVAQCMDVCSPGFVSSTGYAPCYPCAQGYYSVNTTYCSSCPQGQTHSIYGASSINSCANPPVSTETCPIGTESDGNGNCNLCDFGEYHSNAFQISCLTCPGQSTTYVRGAVSSSACIGLCAGGLTSSDGKAPCSACPKGTYYLNSTYCMPCQSGFTTIGVGSINQFACQPESFFRVNCPAGTYRNGSGDNCIICPVGSYQTFENQFQCTQCNAGTSTYVQGATSPTQCRTTCIPGFRSDNGLSPCAPCGISRYWTDSQTCLQCPNGGTTATTTAQSINECIEPCPPGFFSFNGFNQNSGCRPCPENHYQADPQATSCIRCPDSTYTPAKNSTSQSQCIDPTALCSCSNGGTCVARFNGAECICPRGTYGSRCEFIVNYCNSNPCYNGGICNFNLTGHSCDCQGFATGDNCETIVKTCDISAQNPTCKNGGHCINRPGFPQCICAEGFSGTTCADKSDICINKPCNNTVQPNGCVDVSLDADLRRKCNCLPGYEGDDCSINTDECASTPCINGGTCQDGLNTFTCSCPQGYFGVCCEKRIDRCSNINCGLNGVCVDDQKTDARHCVCKEGYAYGTYTQYSITLSSAPQAVTDDQFCTPGIVTDIAACRSDCTNNGACAHFSYQPSTKKCCLINQQSAVNFTTFTQAPFNTYTKYQIMPDDDFYTEKYNVKDPANANTGRDSETLQNLNVVMGLNVCGGTEPLAAQCCRAGGMGCDTVPSGVTCNTQGAVCNNFNCQNVDLEVKFLCAVQRVFPNNACAQKNDYCASNPCENNGFCISQFNGYICSCNAGYTGQNCQTNIDDCANSPCRNGATCTDGVNDYSCSCAQGYEGNDCQSKVNYCIGQSCNNRGSCQILDTDYMCSCNPGYEGKDCQNQIDFCLSQPCLHGSTCTQQVNDFRCECVDGWFGTNCERIVDNCLFTGLQCQATCMNVFNNYYCECPDNTYGNNCQNQPSPCNQYSKCQNNGVCGLNNGAMSCSCPTKYTGDGCQILVDHCGATNRCQNGAMCSNTPSGYSCACPTGYEGTNCETDINECLGVICSGGGTCYDGIGRYYCRCPLNTTGDSCNKGVDANYDLYFRNGLAWIPYFIQVNDASYVSLSMWVRFSTVGGTGKYMTQYMGDRIDTAAKVFEVTERGILVYYGADSNNPMSRLIPLTRNVLMNDGDWHLITNVYNTVSGEMKFYMDTASHGSFQDNSLQLGVATFKMWVVLGCEFDNSNTRCTGSEMLHGYLSQIVWYKRELDFDDIASNFAFSRTVLQPLSQVILLWYEYVPEFGGVERIIPSEAAGVSCTAPTRNPPCSFTTASASPITHTCPGDITVYSPERLITVTWNQPSFTNLGANGIVVPKTILPDNTYTWDVYDALYIAEGQNGYKDYCTFRVYVQESQCRVPANPHGGRDPDCIDNDPTGRKGCRISCYNGFQIDRVTPNLFTCDNTGSWNYARRFEQYRYPSCGAVQSSSPTVNARMKLTYNLGTTACDSVKENLEPLLRNATSVYKGEFVGTLCSQADCQDLQITITCIARVGGRKKRQISSDVEVVINFLNVAGTTMFNTEPLTVSQFLTYMVLGANVYDFPNIINRASIVENLFEITVNPACGPNEVIVNNQCVACGPGNFFRFTDSTNSTAVCDDCPIGTYQDVAAQKECKPCGNGQTTELAGSPESTTCKESCSVGYFYNMTASGCSPCPIGFYQDQVGQFRCKGCSAGFTTEFVGTNSSLRCTGTCDHGQQLDGNGNCEPCPIGQFRNASETRMCVSCNPGFITARIGARSGAACNVTACQVGNKLNVVTNLCEPCPIGSYQDEKWQPTCKSCGDQSKFLTAGTGSSSQTQCFFYCPAGQEVVTNTETCRPCAVGSYKTGNSNAACVPCSGNYRTPTTGSTAASNCSIFKCPVGSEPNAANDDCVLCGLGKYQDVEFSEQCKTCTTGRSTRMMGSNSSSDCEIFCPSGQEKIGTCLSCGQGKYKSNAAGLFSVCQSCNSNYTTVGSGSISVDNCTVRACPAGTKRKADESGCDDCPLGTYQPNPYQISCLACVGTLSTRQTKSTSQSQCETFCNSGSEKNSQGGCDTCPRGYYKDNGDGLFGSCQLCPSINITLSSGATTVMDCNIGNCTAGQKIGMNNVCEACPKGSYQPNKWQNTCLQCGQFKTTENDGASLESECILECDPGAEDVNETCLPCQRGYYKVEKAAAKCTICPDGNTTESTGATTAALCTLPGCLAGTYLDKITDPQVPVCKQCAYDSYQDEIWKESCKTCPNREVTLKLGATMLTDCVSNCSSGQEYKSVNDDCQFCPIGYYRDNGDRAQPQCQMCDAAFITPLVGSTSSAACTIVNCTVPGTYRNTGTNTCELCAIGTYNSVKWNTFCEACQNGYSTRTTGSTSINDCRPTCPLGEQVGVNNVCQRCLVGFYRASLSVDNCTACPDGLLTADAGSTSQDQCNVSPCLAGNFYIQGALQCRPCPVGEYQPAAGSFSCIGCSSGFAYTPSTGSTSESACNSPCGLGFQFDNTTRSCNPCPRGFYQNEANQFVCKECPSGLQYTASTGSTSSNQCLSFCSTQANICSENATCNTRASGAVCSCFSNYDDIGSTPGTQCVHKCDRGYCQNNAVCTRNPTPSCSCSSFFDGDRCEQRIRGDELDDETTDIVIPVAIGAAGLILFLILLAVCCLCYMNQKKSKSKRPSRYTEFNGDKGDRASMHSYDYGQYPYNSQPRFMMPQYQDIVYDNQAYIKGADLDADGSIDTAVYQA